MRTYNVCILGATGEVGNSLRRILEQRNFPINKLYLLASKNSAGKKLIFRGKEIEVLDTATFNFNKVHIGLFSAGGSISEIYAPKAVQAKCIVIDNTSKYRMDADVPLVVPQVNPEDIKLFKKKYIIANPNCSTIQMVVALKPIHNSVGIKNINVSTYQSVSGTGKKAIDELITQIKQYAREDQCSKKSSVYPKPIAFNVLPHIDSFMETGFTFEEMKMHNETKKIMHDSDLNVNATCVRVPVFYGHSEALHISTKRQISPDETRNLFKESNHIQVIDRNHPFEYHTALFEGTDTDKVYISRIRKSLIDKNGLNMWVVADNIRKGAALNSIEIAEELIKNHSNNIKTIN